MTIPGKLVVDASVAVKWYVPELGSIQASSLLETEEQLLAPELLLAEFGSVLWKKVRRGELAVEEAEAIVDAFVSTAPVRFYPLSPLLPAAFDIATDFQRTVYDALYLALAVAENCPIVTADDKLARAIHGTALEPYVRSLAPAPDRP